MRVTGYLIGIGALASACGFDYDNPIENGPAGSIRGTLVSRALTGAPGGLTADQALVPVAGAACTLEGTDKSATTGADGAFVLTRVKDGSYILICKYTTTASRVLVVLRVVEVAGGVPVEMGSLEMVVAGAIAGRATLAGQASHTGILVYVPGLSFLALTGAAGNFIISEVPPGSYSLRYEKDGYLPMDVGDVVVEAELTTTVTDIVLPLSTGPSGTILIADGALVWPTRTVPVKILATPEATLLQLSDVESFLNAEWQPRVDSTSWTFSTDGAKSLYAKFFGSGIESAPVADDIIVDTTPPMPGTILIHAGGIPVLCDAATDCPTVAKACEGGVCFDPAGVRIAPNTWTASQQVFLQLTAVDEASWLTDMMLSSDPAFTGADWEPYAPTRSFTLPDGDGEKTVYARFRDAVDLESTVAGGSVTLETVAPAAPSFSLEPAFLSPAGVVVDSGFTPSRDVRARIVYDPAVATVLFSEDPGFAASARLPQDVTDMFLTLTEGDGEKTVYARALDAAGNASAVVAVPIVLDTTPPMAPVVDAPHVLVEPDVTITIVTPAADANLRGYHVCAGFTCMEYAANQTSLVYRILNLSSTVIEVRAIDRAGNASEPATLTVVVEQLAFALMPGQTIYPSTQVIRYMGTRPLVHARFDISGNPVPVEETPVDIGGGVYEHVLTGLGHGGTYSVTITATDAFGVQASGVWSALHPSGPMVGCLATTASTAELALCPPAEFASAPNGPASVPIYVDQGATLWRTDVIDPLPAIGGDGCYRATLTGLTYAPAHTYAIAVRFNNPLSNGISGTAACSTIP